VGRDLVAGLAGPFHFKRLLTGSSLQPSHPRGIYRSIFKCNGQLKD
jgi:hypothetical protein